MKIYVNSNMPWLSDTKHNIHFAQESLAWTQQQLHPAAV